MIKVNKIQICAMAALTCVVMLAGCGLITGPEQEDFTPPGPPPPPLLLELEMQDTVSRDSELVIRMVLRNESDEAVEVVFSGPATRDGEPNTYFAAIGDSDRPIWSSGDFVFLDALAGKELLRPGDERVFEEVWDLRSNRNRRLSPGTYRLYGVLDVQLMDHFDEPQLQRGYGTAGREIVIR